MEVDMQSSFTLTKDEVNLDFLNKIKSFFTNGVSSIKIDINNDNNKISEIPNAETIAAMKETREIVKNSKKGTKNINDFFDELNSLEA